MDDPPATRGLLERVFTAQRFAVLATMRDQQPCGNLIAFAVSDDLRHIIFATSRKTQKYRNMLSNNRVALLVDTRSNDQSDLVDALAITALGTAGDLAGDERDRLVGSYLAKHPSLGEFLHRPDVSVIKVLVTDYILARFDGAERIRIDDIPES